MTPFERSFSKLSENPNFGSTEFKCYGSWKISITWILWIQSQDFLKAWKNTFQMVLIKVHGLYIYSPWSEAEKWQIRARTKFWIETHHLKGIFLTFLTLDQLYSSYGCWKMFNYTPTPSVSFNCHNLNSVDPKSIVLIDLPLLKAQPILTCRSIIMDKEAAPKIKATSIKAPRFHRNH